MKTQNSNLKYIRAKNRVERTKRFYSHLAVYFIINSIITGFKVSNNLDSWDNFMSEITSINVLSSWVVWGIFLILHFLAFKYGQGWEERKIEALMNNELTKDSKQ